MGDYPELAHLIRQARVINDSMPDYVLNRVCRIMDEIGMDDFSRVGFYGLTYKENVDDVRESPTLQMIESMRHHLAKPPKCYDPMVEKDVVDGQYHSFEAFLEDVDFLVVMVHHKHLDSAAAAIQGKTILDTRNCRIEWPEENKIYFL